MPSLTTYIPIGNKMQKLGHLIFESGQVLLTRKIEAATNGQPEEKYSVSQHLEMLNDMFPETMGYNPIEMKKKIENFKELAKKKIQKAPQVKKDSYLYAGQIWEEEQIKFTKLLRQADMLSLEPVQQQYSRHGAQSRYEGTLKTVDVDALEDEEEESCVNCGNPKNLVEIPDVGKVCRACIAAQKAGGTPNKASQQEEVSCLLCGNANDLFEIAKVGKICDECIRKDGGKPSTRDNASQQEEQANIQLNKELHEMDDSPFNVPRGPKINNGASSSRRNFDDDNSYGNTDDEIRTALLGHLRMSSKREVLETEKARLDVLIKQRELERLGGSKNDEI